MNFEDHLRRSYLLPGHPLALSNLNKIYDYYEGELSKDTIKEILSSIESYSIHKEFHEGQRNPSYSHFKRYQFQCDLVDIRDLAKYNDGVNYLFTCIDTFTRYAFVRLLQSKHGECAVRAFESILEEANTPPVTLVMDRGSEFYNADFENFCASRNIRYYPPDSSSHGAYIERFNRTLQGIIYRYMTENETLRFIDKSNEDGSIEHLMPKFLTTYNNSNHRMIGTTPAIAENDDSTHLEIRKKMSEYHDKIKKKNDIYKVGELVRIARLRGKFDRGYKDRASTEIFKIDKVVKNKKIPMYVLSNYRGDEIIKGSFYAFELVKVTRPEEIYRVERVLAERMNRGSKELLVKWRGFDDSYNSWIKESDIVQRF
jgi:hypothetical protein